MRVNMDIRRSSLLLIVFSALVANCYALIPLIGWSSSNAFSSVKGSQFSSANDFIYASSLEKVNIVILFTSPELSFDSLAKYGGIYGEKNPALDSLQSEVKASKSSVWVGAGGTVASDLVSTLSFLLNTQPYAITGPDEVAPGRKFFKVVLPAASDEEGFIVQDDIISTVMSAVKKLPGSPTYAAIYTSNHVHLPRSSHMRSESLRSVNNPGMEVFRATRQNNDDNSDDEHVKCAKLTKNSTSSSNLNPNTDPCMLFCINTTIVRFHHPDPDDVIEETLSGVDFVDGACDASRKCADYGAACIHVRVRANSSYNEAADEHDMIFVFPRGHCKDDTTEDLSLNNSVRCGFYSMKLYIDDQLYRQGTEERYIFEKLQIPAGTAYACGNNNIRNNYTATNHTIEGAQVRAGGSAYTYHFNDLQFQVYKGFSQAKSTGNAVFGSVYNCQSYLGHISLMGLVAVLLLVIILYVAVISVFSVKTMDRYDDPRGKTITVENLH